MYGFHASHIEVISRIHAEKKANHADLWGGVLIKNKYTRKFFHIRSLSLYIFLGTLSEKVEWTYKVYDIGGSGTISKSNVVEITKAARVPLLPHQLDRVFAARDTNHDGKVSIE